MSAGIPPSYAAVSDGLSSIADAPEQRGLFTEAEEDESTRWWREWRGMPEFTHEDLSPVKTLYVHFESRADLLAFARLVEQPLTTRTRSIWYPKAEIGRYADKRYIVPGGGLTPLYPVYVISKGRWESRLTVRALDKIGVPYRVVIEPQEHAAYAAVIAPDKLLVLPFSNLGQGSIPARNWVWEHARAAGAAWHWILDDNIGGFYRFHHNLKTPVGDGTIFRAAELFVERYENVAQAGFNYFMFAARKEKAPPLYLNTRIYSCILLRNDLPYEWRGRYNEDTDLSLRLLKDGYCTVLFNAFLAGKAPTMRMAGGNTDELYRGNGRLQMAESLREQHPDVAAVTVKWGRYQHYVNYAPFRGNKLIRRADAPLTPDPNNLGMVLQDLVDGRWETRVIAPSSPVIGLTAAPGQRETEDERSEEDRGAVAGSGGEEELEPALSAPPLLDGKQQAFSW